jgi:putative transposase
MVKATRPNEKWSMDFVAARLLDGRWFRVLTVVDQFTRECLALLADSSLTGHKVALALSQVVAERGAPVSITVDNGSEFVSKAMAAWAYQYRVDLEFIRPGRPVENGYIESFNGRLRDECLNVQVFFALADVREKLEQWRHDYNRVRPHSALNDGTPAHGRLRRFSPRGSRSSSRYGYEVNDGTRRTSGTAGSPRSWTQPCGRSRSSKRVASVAMG